MFITFTLPHTFLSFEYIFHILPQSTQSTQRFLQFLRALCALCGNHTPSTGGWRIIPQSTQSTQRFLQFSVPSVLSVVTIHPARKDHTTEHPEHTEVAPILRARCALCGNNTPSTGGWRIIPQSTQSTQRFLPFSVPSVHSVVTIHPAREDGGSYHRAHRAHRGCSNSLCPLCSLW